MKCRKLIYRSPVFGSVCCEQHPDEDARYVYFGPETAYMLYKKGPEVLLFLTEHAEDLSDCVPEELTGLIVRADFGLCDVEDDKLYLITEIYVRQEPTEDEYGKIIDWIDGQMSDGWGEGVEQKTVLSEELTFCNPRFDDDLCEFYTDEFYGHAEYYIHPWSSDPRCVIQLVDRETVELDVEEPDMQEDLRQTVLRIKELVDQIVEELKNVT